ncbi:PucR family transcriptional regulator [Streptantibioticus ferralitis]|uniref:Helix-turn-helix domain-containing protein n=1 Tax=Streptantibioticus ferralitis TaxID=236510 RepID=A0ABT5YZ67_9ACTN|nr:helix-turn-helix domain-containing protein [Streptantibioticus ferralitis]MDF2256080.1 helix-turn-helix domain-containing protein [Streptantibioticus ferralitis]
MSVPAHIASVRAITSATANDAQGQSDVIPMPRARPSDGHETVVPALAEMLIRQAPQLIEQLMELAASRDVEHFQQLSAADIRRSLREHVLGFLRFLADKPTADADPLTVPMSWGRYRAQEGVPLESMLRVHRLAARLLWEKLFDGARARSPEVLQRLLDESGPVWDVLDSYSLALVEGYRSAESDARRQDAARRDALFDALIEGRGVEPAVAAEARVALGLPTRGRFVVVALDADTGGSSRTLCSALPAHAVQAVWRLRSDREIGVLELGRTPLRRLVDWLSVDPGHRVGISGEVDSLADIATAYHFAETALQTLRYGTTGVAAFDDRLLEAFVVTSPHVAQRLARRAFGRLLDCPPDERDVLLTTLDAWFRCGCSAAKAAERLHCHRNTVLNRLRRVEALTGSSLDDDRYQLACQMALVAVHTLPLTTPARTSAQTSAETE